MYWDGGWHMWWMAASWIVSLAVLIAIMWLLMKAAHGAGPTVTEESPELILKRRYARGEIDTEEYQRRLTDLRR